MPTPTRFILRAPSDSALLGFAKCAAEKLMGVNRLARALDGKRSGSARNFIDHLATRAGLRVTVRGLDHFPRRHSGPPLLVVANHPRGILDGVCLFRLLYDSLKRDDFHFLANLVLARVFPELSPHLLNVNNFSAPSPEITVQNAAALVQALRQLNRGGIVAVHPAGAVSQFRWRSSEGICRVTDMEWQTSFVGLWRRSGATVIPIHLSGRNSLLFQLAGLLGPTAKRLRLFHEYLACRSEDVTVSIGTPVSAQALEGFSDDRAAARYVREMVYLAPNEQRGAD